MSSIDINLSIAASIICGLDFRTFFFIEDEKKERENAMLTFKDCNLTWFTDSVKYIPIVTTGNVHVV
jgi:hypothetical protein